MSDTDEITALRAEVERLRAALDNIRHKRREMDMGDLSADEAVWEADVIARAALAAQPAPKEKSNAEVRAANTWWDDTDTYGAS